jgi:hypothetical protein
MFALHMVGEMRPQNVPLVISLLVICLLSGFTCIIVELRTKKSPIVPLRLMLKDGIGLICAGQILLVFCQFGVKVQLSCYQSVSKLIDMLAYFEFRQLCHTHSECAEQYCWNSLRFPCSRSWNWSPRLWVFAEMVR